MALHTDNVLRLFLVISHIPHSPHLASSHFGSSFSHSLRENRIFTFKHFSKNTAKSNKISSSSVSLNVALKNFHILSLLRVTLLIGLKTAHVPSHNHCWTHLDPDLCLLVPVVLLISSSTHAGRFTACRVCDCSRPICY